MSIVNGAADESLRTSLLRLLTVDRFPRTGEMLGADDRLLGPAANALLHQLVAEAERGAIPHAAALVEQYRSFLGRCTPDTLAAVFPAGAQVVDPQVVAAVRPDLDRAWAADTGYQDGGTTADLDVADRAWRRVLRAPALGHAYPDLKAALLNDAAGTALRSFWHHGERADLVRAGDLYRAALDLTPRISARRVVRLGNLAMVRRETHHRYGPEDTIAEAEALLREAVALVDRSGGQLAGAEVLTNLALVLRDRYLLESDPDVLTDAVTTAERACAASDSPGPRIMLGDLLSQRFLVSGAVDDVRRAVGLLRDAVEQLPDGAPERPRGMVDLAVALSERHGALGDPADLDEAVGLIETARALLPAAAPDLPSAHAQLAVMLYRRFESSGRLDDLDRAAELLTGVIATAPGDEIAVPTWRTNLAAVLVQRSRRTGSPDDLDRAIDIFAELTATGDIGTDRYALLNNLGNALRDRSRRTPSESDLDRAVVLLREAIGLCADGSARHAATLSNLGVALHDRFLLTGSSADLDASLDATGRAVRMAGEDSDLARRWFARALAAQAAADRRSATWGGTTVAAYREGCRIGLAVDPESTLIAAQDWGGWSSARSEWDDAAEAYLFAVDAAELLVVTQVERDHQEVWLRATPTLPGRAAWAAASAGRPVDAVVALERTRAVLLSEALRRDRVDLIRLGRERPDLSERYQRAASALGRAGSR